MLDEEEDSTSRVLLSDVASFTDKLGTLDCWLDLKSPSRLSMAVVIVVVLAGMESFVCCCPVCSCLSSVSATFEEDESSPKLGGIDCCIACFLISSSLLSSSSRSLTSLISRSIGDSLR